MHPRILCCGHGLLDAADFCEAQQALAIVFVICDSGGEGRGADLGSDPKLSTRNLNYLQKHCSITFDLAEHVGCILARIGYQGEDLLACRALGSRNSVISRDDRVRKRIKDWLQHTPPNLGFSFHIEIPFTHFLCLSDCPLSIGSPIELFCVVRTNES
jgi:hypothetical protein